MNDEWQTPDDLFQRLDSEFRFDLDLCTNGRNSKCRDFSTDAKTTAYYIRPIVNAIWLNPPYSRGKINECMDAAHQLAHAGNTVVALVRFDPSAKWFQTHVHGVADEVRMMRNRVKFKGASSAYNFPTCVVVYCQWRKNVCGTNYFPWSITDDTEHYPVNA
jgi:phage N-6-adenine-methyltransferase